MKYLGLLLIPLSLFSQKYEYEYKPVPYKSIQDVEYKNNRSYLLSKSPSSIAGINVARVGKESLEIAMTFQYTGDEKTHFIPEEAISIRAITKKGDEYLNIISKTVVLNEVRNERVKYYGGGRSTQNMQINSMDNQGNMIRTNVSYTLPSTRPISSSMPIKQARIDWFTKYLIGNTTLRNNESVTGIVLVSIPKGIRDIEGIKVILKPENAGVHIMEFKKD